MARAGLRDLGKKDLADRDMTDKVSFCLPFRNAYWLRDQNAIEMARRVWEDWRAVRQPGLLGLEGYSQRMLT